MSSFFDSLKGLLGMNKSSTTAAPAGGLDLDNLLGNLNIDATKLAAIQPLVDQVMAMLKGLPQDSQAKGMNVASLLQSFIKQAAAPGADQVKVEAKAAELEQATQTLSKQAPGLNGLVQQIIQQVMGMLS
ncbi:hypothetical protein MASR2M15_08510 [Anaerolineales bacterium]